jgi:hypothetical protein
MNGHAAAAANASLVGFHEQESLEGSRIATEHSSHSSYLLLSVQCQHC